MIEISHKLKEARIHQGLSIEEVSHHIKIRPEHLRNIEENNKKDLPHLSYVKGFIRTYATYLKLDTVKILEEFNNSLVHTETHQDQEKQKLYWESIPLINKLNFNLTSLVVFLIGLTSLLLTYANSIYMKYSSESQPIYQSLSSEIKYKPEILFPKVHIEEKMRSSKESSL